MKKYRVWDEIDNSWIPSEYLMMNPEGKIYTSLHKDDNTYMTETIPLKICFSTRLKDKNDKEIYEGDIVQFRTRRFRGKKQSLRWKTFRSVVVYEDGAFVISEGVKYNDTYLAAMVLREDEKSEGMKPVEIIGNIYENPELVK